MKRLNIFLIVIFSLLLFTATALGDMYAPGGILAESTLVATHDYAVPTSKAVSDYVIGLYTGGASDPVLMATTNKLEFRDTGIYLYSPSDGVLTVVSDTTLNITAPAITITGAISQVGAITMATTSKIQFLDTGLYVYSSANGVLDVVSDTTLNLTAPSIVLTGITNFIGVSTHGTSGARLTHVAATPTLQVYTTNNSTGSADAVPVLIDSLMTGAGGVGQALKVQNKVATVALGAYVNAIYGILDLGSTGSVVGLGAPICAEIVFNTGTAGGAGTLAGVEIELTTGAATVFQAGTVVSCIYISANGATKGVIDDNAFLIDLAGFTSGTDHMWYDKGSSITTGNGSEWIRVRTPGGYRYLILYDSPS